MNRKACMKKMILSLAMGVASASLFAEDGTMAQSGNWGKGSTWGGTVPAFGAGSTLTTLPNAAATLSLLTNDVTVGHIATTASGVNADAAFTMASMSYGRKYADAVTPNNGVDGDWSWGGLDGRLVFDNGAEPATVEVGATASDKFAYRHVYNVPVVLKSDLSIRNAYAGTASASEKFPTQPTTVVFGQKITDDGAKKGITVANDSKVSAVNFAADNDFTGDVNVQGGFIRAVRHLGWGGEGTPFGHDNTVRAAGGAVDLAGLKTPASQTLEIGGGFTTGLGTFGALFSSCQDPDITAVWQGPVTLTADATFGGTHSGLQGWRAWTAQNFGGNLEVSGGISGAFAAHVTGVNTVTFSGANTFSGGLYLDSSTSGQTTDPSFFKATSDAAFGTGGVHFNGGIYLVDADSADLSRQPIACEGTSAARLFVSKGVVYEPENGLSVYSLTKEGPGALCLSKASTLNSKGVFTLNGGELILDSKNNLTVQQLMGTSAPSACNKAKITLRDSIGGHTSLGHELNVKVQEGASLTIARATDDLPKTKIPGINVNELSLVTLLTPSESGTGFGGYGSTVNPTGKHILSPNIVMDGRSWPTYKVKSVLSPFDGFVNEWGNATNFIDATSEFLASDAPDGTTCAAIRFNEPAGESLTLTVAGTLTVAEGAVLVTPGMGSTKAVIAGGTLRNAASGGTLRFYNFNTNAPLEIASTIAGRYVFFGGPGKIILSGDNAFSSKCVIACGELEVTTPLALGGAGSASDWGSNNSTVGRRFIVTGGPTLTFPSSMDALKWLGPDTATYPLFVCDNGGLTINVPTAGSTVTLAGTTAAQFQLSGGTLRKTGAGTLACSLPIASVDARTHRIEIVGGGWTAPDGKAFADMFGAGCGNYTRSRAVVVASNGVSLCGCAFTPAHSTDLLNGRKLVVGEGGATIDIHGAMSVWSGMADDGLDHGDGFFAGDGDLTFVDSLATGDLSTTAGVSTYAHTCDAFAGKMTFEVPLKKSKAQTTPTSYGAVFPNAEWSIAADTAASVYWIYSPVVKMALGALSGAGTFAVSVEQNTSHDSVFEIGGNRAGTADFSGSLSLTRGSNAAYPRLVKVGTGAQRVSGDNAALRGSVTVREGTLLAGSATAFGQSPVYVGDAGSETSASFLVDGAYTLVNKLAATPSPATAACTIGGTETADGAVFAGDVVLHRDVTLQAAANTTVRFTGAFTGIGAIRTAGAGTVELAQAPALTSYSLGATTLKIDDDLVFPEGTTIAVDASLCTKENRERTFVLLEANSISGDFTVTTALPDGWRVSKRGGKLCLSVQKGLVLLVR